MNNITASGAPSYADIEDIVEALVNTEGRKHPIPGMDFEDTAQEIRMECVRVLASFNADRIGPSPFKYLQVCIKNFLFNKRRGIYVPNNPPCVRCPLWDKVNKTCKVDEIDCDKIVKYRADMSRKADLKRPSSLEIDITDIGKEEEIEVLILDQSIRSALGDKLLPYYDKMLNGEKISPKIKKQIREIATNIINNAENLSN